jgi:hypothetical protein
MAVTAGSKVLNPAASAAPPISKQINTKKGRVSSALKKILKTCFITGKTSQFFAASRKTERYLELADFASGYHMKSDDARELPEGSCIPMAR